MDGKIYIPKPCHENWNKMSPEEKGRHCAVCSKVVKDFTSMPKNEIIDVLKKTEGEVCGRINAKEITPTTKKQKIFFLINGWLYRKAIYPVMALLGISFVTKKAMAQTDYPVKGKMAYNDYHVSSKKITVVVKAPDGTTVLPYSTINITGGIRKVPDAFTTDANGKAVIELKAENLIGDQIEAEVYANGYETKLVTIQLIKNVQTVEVKMEQEFIIMGEMMYIPEENINIETVEDKRDSSEKIQVTKCSIIEVTSLPLISKDTVYNDIFEPEMDTNTTKVQLFDEVVQSNFDIYPNPASDFVNIATRMEQVFNLDMFDEHGKKLQSVMNGKGYYNLDVSSYSNGIYYVLVTVDGKAIETKKIIVTR